MQSSQWLAFGQTKFLKKVLFWKYWQPHALIINHLIERLVKRLVLACWPMLGTINCNARHQWASYYSHLIIFTCAGRVNTFISNTISDIIFLLVRIILKHGKSNCKSSNFDIWRWSPYWDYIFYSLSQLKLCFILYEIFKQYMWILFKVSLKILDNSNTDSNFL